MSHELNKPPDADPNTHHWQVEHIRQGLREAEAGEFASEAEVAQVIAHLLQR